MRDYETAGRCAPAEDKSRYAPVPGQETGDRINWCIVETFKRSNLQLSNIIYWQIPNPAPYDTWKEVVGKNKLRLLVEDNLLVYG